MPRTFVQMFGSGGDFVSPTTQVHGPIALEGTPIHVTNSGTNPTTIGPFTTTKATQVMIVCTSNATSGIASITGGGLTWTHRATGAAGDSIESWTATASAALSGVTFTVNFTATGSFVSMDVFAFSGVDSATIFDGNASIPANNASGALSVSTNNANDVIIGGYRTEQNPSNGAGWTLISGANFQLTEYKIVSATQSGLSIATSNDPATVGGVGDALMMS